MKHLKIIIPFFVVLIVLTFKVQAQTVSDIDGNVYDTLHIGTQIWLKQNLKTTRYNNGDSIDEITNEGSWTNSNSGAFCWYNNDSEAYDSIYGALYNWHAVNSENLCPIGWHVPTNDEWITLIDYLGGANVAGGEMKETDTLHWSPPNTGAINSVNFTALPGGGRLMAGAFDRIEDYGYWWSASEHNGTNSWSWRMAYNSAGISNLSSSKQHGLSVRCVKDLSTTTSLENDEEESIRIYPNPVIDKVYINHSGNRNISIHIYSVLGECFLQKELHSGVNAINLSSFSKGIYFIKFIDDKEIFISKKIVKE